MLKTIIKILICLTVITYAAMSNAADKADLDKEFDKVEEQRAQGSTVMTITQIFGQTLANALPQGFVPISENVKSGFYIQEFVLKGETLSQWTQKITISGSKGLSSVPNLTPEKFLAIAVVGGIKSICPNSYSIGRIGESKIDGYDAFAAILSCGEVPTSAGKVSEVFVTLTIKGDADYYTIQWTERGFPSSTALALDKNMWNERVAKLMPIKLCAIIPGEQKPYPSCTSQIKK